MQQIILTLHLLLAVILIGLVLMQRGKGASMGAAFGSGASQTLFGSRGSISFLVKVTILVATLFFGTSIGLTYMASKAAKRTQNNASLSNVEKMANKISDKEQAIIQKNTDIAETQPQGK